MSKLLKFIALVVVIILVAAVLGWWWYLRPEPMEPPELPGVSERGEMEFGGHSRSWLTYIPAARAERPALVLVMHGSLGDGEGMRSATRFSFDVLAERHGFVVVYPDGYRRHWNDCRAGADYAAKLENIDDVGFLRALVRRMVVEQQVRSRQGLRHRFVQRRPDGVPPGAGGAGAGGRYRRHCRQPAGARQLGLPTLGAGGRRPGHEWDGGPGEPL